MKQKEAAEFGQENVKERGTNKGNTLSGAVKQGDCNSGSYSESVESI